MAHINLLPWRDWERERKKKEFLTNLVGVLVIGGVLVGLGGWLLDSSVKSQNARNSFMQTKIAVIDARIVEINALQKEKQELLARMQVIQDLQGNRPLIVRVFNETVRTLSKGIHYRSIEMKGKNFTVEGTAESNNRISALMRNLDESNWFSTPNLRSIKEATASSVYGDQASTFDLTYIQVSPNDDEPGGD